MWLWANGITTAWGGVPNGTLSMMFTCCPNFVSSFSVTGDMEISNWSFCWLWAFQSWYLFCLLWASQICPYLFFFTTVDRSQLLYSVWVRHTTKNNPNALRLTKIQEPRSMIQSAGIKNWFPQSINSLYMFNLLFLSVTRFFWLLP